MNRRDHIHSHSQMTSSDPLNTDALPHLQHVLNRYVWKNASDEELTILKAERFKYAPYMQPFSHTTTNTAYLSLLATIFEESASVDPLDQNDDTYVDVQYGASQQTACMLEAERLRALLAQPVVSTWTVNHDQDWLKEEDDGEEIYQDEVDPFKIVLLNDDGTEEKTGTVHNTTPTSTPYWKSQSLSQQARNSEPTTSHSEPKLEFKPSNSVYRNYHDLLSRAVEWAVETCEFKEYDILAHVYMEGEANVDRDQFSESQLCFLYGAFMGYAKVCASQNKLLSVACEREAHRLYQTQVRRFRTVPNKFRVVDQMGDAKEREEKGEQDVTQKLKDWVFHENAAEKIPEPSPKDEKLEQPKPVRANIVMEPPPRVIRQPFRSEQQWYRDFRRVATSIFPATYLTERQTARDLAKQQKFREWLPLHIRDQPDTERFIRMNCTQFDLAFLKQVLNSMGDDA